MAAGLVSIGATGLVGAEERTRIDRAYLETVSVENEGNRPDRTGHGADAIATGTNGRALLLALAGISRIDPFPLVDVGPCRKRDQ